jgi:hypothetical protein
MKETIVPLHNAAGKVRDFYVKVRDCESCARRRAKITSYIRMANKQARDLMRQRPVK